MYTCCQSFVNFYQTGVLSGRLNFSLRKEGDEGWVGESCSEARNLLRMIGNVRRSIIIRAVTSTSIVERLEYFGSHTAFITSAISTSTAFWISSTTLHSATPLLWSKLWLLFEFPLTTGMDGGIITVEITEDLLLGLEFAGCITSPLQNMRLARVHE